MANNEEVNGCASGCAGCSGCGHDHMELPEDMSPIITLTDEDGKDVKFEILDVVALEDERSFLIVTEVTEEDEEGDVEVVILEIKQDGEEEVYDTVTDEELAKQIFEKFTKQQEELDEE